MVRVPLGKPLLPPANEDQSYNHQYHGDYHQDPHITIKMLYPKIHLHCEFSKDNGFGYLPHPRLVASRTDLPLEGEGLGGGDLVASLLPCG